MRQGNTQATHRSVVHNAAELQCSDGWRNASLHCSLQCETPVSVRELQLQQHEVLGHSKRGFKPRPLPVFFGTGERLILSLETMTSRNQSEHFCLRTFKRDDR